MTLSPRPDLRLDLTSVVPAGEPYIRHLVLDEISELLPKEPRVRVGMYVAGIQPGAAVEWHVHNGAVFFLVIQGRVTLQYEHGEEHYQAGDAYSEPIGQIHRALNPHESVEAVLFGFAATAADRQHVINVGAPAWSREG
jgi:quercetin dioxygenase-like cupin family protein